MDFNAVREAGDSFKDFADSYDDAMEEAEELIGLVNSDWLYSKHKWSSRLVGEDASELILKEKQNG